VNLIWLASARVVLYSRRKRKVLEESREAALQ